MELQRFYPPQIPCYPAFGEGRVGLVGPHSLAEAAFANAPPERSGGGHAAKALCSIRVSCLGDVTG